MKVLILKTAGGPDGVFKKGAILDLKKEVAQPLIDCGVARLFAEKEEDKREKAVAPAIENREKRKR